MQNFMSSTKVHESFSEKNALFSKQSFVSREQEMLADYVRRVREEKGLSLNQVRIRSGYQIANSYISRIENGEVTNVGLDKLQSLAKGLDISDEEIFAVARGKSTSGDFQLKELRLLEYFRALTEDRQDDVLAHVELACKLHAGESGGRGTSLIPPGGRRMPVVTKGGSASKEREQKRA